MLLPSHPCSRAWFGKESVHPPDRLSSYQSPQQDNLASLTDNIISLAQDGNSDLEDDNLSDLGSEMDEAKHIEDLKALAEKDPEFFKYLQENDAELLDFEGKASADEEGGEASESDSEDEDSEDEDDKKSKKGKGKEKEVKAAQELTKDVLKRWQKSMLEVRCSVYALSFASR